MGRRSQDRIRGYYYKTKDDLRKSDLYKTNRLARDHIETMLTLFRHLLTQMDYFSHYFNRKCSNRHPTVVAAAEDAVDAATPKKQIKLNVNALFEQQMETTSIGQRLCVALCNQYGEFRCQGLWNREECSYNDHTINPYASRENAILFQIWNLDHRIEISRSIIPSILETVQAFVASTGGARSMVRCERHRRRARSVSVMKYFLEIFTVDNLKFVHIVCHDKGVHDGRRSGGRVLCELCEEHKFLQSLLKATKQ